MSQKLSRGSIVIPVILFGIVMLGMISYIVYKSMTPRALATPSAIPADNLTPAAAAEPVKDFAPNLPANQKSTIVIRLSDSSTTKYLVPKDQVDTYIKNLPQGSTVVSASK